MNRLRRAVLGVTVLTGLAAPALSQVAGTYAGYSADSEFVQFKIAPLKDTGKLGVREAAVVVQAKCEYRRIDAVGAVIYSVGQEIRGGVVTAERAVAPAFDIRFRLTFAPDGRSATGSIRSIIPGLDVKRLGAEQALFCISPNRPCRSL